MKLPRLTRSGLLLAVLVSAVAVKAQTTAVEFNRRAVSERWKGNLDAAVDDFNRAIALDPQYAVAYSNRGGTKRFKNDLDGALADFNQAIALKPDYAAAYNGRGLVKLGKRDFDGAKADFLRAIELDPKHRTGLINLASARNHRVPPTPGAANANDEAAFARLEQANRDAVNALAAPPPPDK